MLVPTLQRLVWGTSITSLVAAGSVAAQLKRPIPHQPANWKPGAEARAFATGAATITREFVWGQEVEPVSGTLRLRAMDNTWGDAAVSEDTLVECLARVTVPRDHAEYYVKLTRLRPMGSRRPTMGGVMINQDLFGNTDIGGPGLFPRLRAHVAVWGLANVVRNGKVIGRDRTALVWVGEGARAKNGKWLYDPDKTRASAHLIVFGSLGHGEQLDHTADGFLHFTWPTAKIVTPGFTLDPYSPPMKQMGTAMPQE